jgi:hypothetical protein
MTKQDPPYRPQLIARAIRRLGPHLSYRQPASRRPLSYAVLERVRAEAVLLVFRVNETRAETVR